MNKHLQLELQKASLIETTTKQFNCRLAEKGRNKSNISISMAVRGNHLLVTFSEGEEQNTLDIPLPFIERNVLLIERNEVKRPICDFLIKETDQRLSYLTIVQRIIMGTNIHFMEEFVQKKLPFIQQIVNSFTYGNTSIAIRNLQRAINYVIDMMPVHSTYMKSWAMNHRLIIIDPSFKEIQDPDIRLEYQVEKSKEYFNRGWTPIGLSDGVLADKNYILTEDLRKTVPFGFSYHNPQRNLYSTLGMKGAEDSLIRTRTMDELRKGGLNRKGWNLFTAFADVPEVWEDQILVDNSLKDHYITYQRRVQGFGRPLVKVGEIVRRGTKLCESPDGEFKFVEFHADRIWVDNIVEKDVIIGGSLTKSYTFIIKFNRKLKDGVKITNRAANKGVIRFKDLGYAACNGHKRKIQVLVSSKAVLKRKNYTQILEALMNTVTKEEGAVIEDNYCPKLEAIEEALERNNFPKDGCWDCDTYAGKFKAVCGKVFWGVTMDVEDMVWSLHDTTRRNSRNIRTAGIKFSTVEFRALETRFGINNPISDEIMSYAQGAEDLHEMMNVLRSKRGEIIGKVTIPLEIIKPLDLRSGTLFDKQDISGTVADASFAPNGFMLQLPVKYQVVFDQDGKVVYEGFPAVDVEEEVRAGNRVVEYNKIYVPGGNLRGCWRHDSGKYGLSHISALLNSLVVTGYRYLSNTNDGNFRASLYRTIYSYLRGIANLMGTKRGEVSSYGMAVRYPFSVKAVATLSSELEENTVQIHREMANNLKVTDGDVVLVERFPCLGFMSLRPQKVVVTHDPMCRFTIRVSGNSLASLSLDFDGDVIYLASFHTKAAKAALRKEITCPNEVCYNEITKLNDKSGVPHYKAMSLQEYNIMPFQPLTVETHAALVDKATGVKAHTGPVIALCYNIMRLIENSDVSNNQEINVAVEMFLDKVGNSVFKQKHGIKSLHQIVTDAICTADVEVLVNEGFRRKTSSIICTIIKQKAKELKVFDLKKYHIRAKKFGSNIISRLVREQNKIYFSSRASLEGCEMLSLLEQDPVDIPSRMFKWVLSGKTSSHETILDSMINEEMLKGVKDKYLGEKVREMCDYIEELFSKHRGNYGYRHAKKIAERLHNYKLHNDKKEVVYGK